VTTNEDVLSPEINAIADDFLHDFCESQPLIATEAGFSEYEDRVGDLSPRSQEQLADAASSTLQKLGAQSKAGFYDQLCADVLGDFCEEIVDAHHHLDWIRNINVITNELDTIHNSCHNIDETDTAALEKREVKIAAIPLGIETFKETLLLGRDKKCLPRQLQIAHIADNCDLYASDSLFKDTPAANAFKDIQQFLRAEILPFCDEENGVGKETYERFSARHLGKEEDAQELYEWGWHEIHSLFDEANHVINELNPGGTMQSTVELLNNDESRTLHDPQELQKFLQDLLDESVEQLDGKHFDIDPRLKKVEACLLENSGSSAMFYSAPSDDFSRSGRTYYPLTDQTSFPLWHEVTTCYHEGLPGHHLHIGFIKCLGDKLSQFQKELAFSTGEGEGWALYAERLMVELGLSTDPAYIFGMLNASMFRAVRVVMDTGLQCGFTIPDTAPDVFARGEKWSENNSIELLETLIGMPYTFSRDEVHRYLGWIGQAPSYKYGEHAIRNLREKERKRLGSQFSLKDFHSQLLGYGHVRLGRLEKLFAA
jgi:uncharacterized protein (DUF885 family)